MLSGYTTVEQEWTSGVDTKYQCTEEFFSMEQVHHLHGGTIQTVRAIAGSKWRVIWYLTKTSKTA